MRLLPVLRCPLLCQSCHCRRLRVRHRGVRQFHDGDVDIGIQSSTRTKEEDEEEKDEEEEEK
jgi:hypothetical protein